MSAKTSPARRAAFLTALGETGNYAIAAAHAKVSRSWVTLHKTHDPEFRAACDAGVAGAAALAKERAAAGGSAKRSARWGYIDGEEMVVRAGNGRRAVVARARLRQWTPRTEVVFLRTLAASANVKLACEAAGLSVASAYIHRSKWPPFAERWQAALENGYVRLEFAMVEHACPETARANILRKVAAVERGYKAGLTFRDERERARGVIDAADWQAAC